MAVSGPSRDEGIRAHLSERQEPYLPFGASAQRPDTACGTALPVDRGLLVRPLADGLLSPAVLRPGAGRDACSLLFAAWCRSGAPALEAVPEPAAARRAALEPAVLAALANAFPARGPSHARGEANTARPPAPAVASRARTDGAAVAAGRLLAAVLAERPEAVAALADGLVSEDLSPDTLVASVMPEVAARLDEAFRSDRCSAVDRTVGVCALRTLLDRLASRRRIAACGSPLPPVRVVLWSAEGDPISFAPALHGFRLRQNGAEVETLEGASPAALLEHLVAQPADILVVSCLEPARCGRTARHLQQVREASPLALHVIGLGDGFEPFAGHPDAVGLDVLVHGPSETLEDVAATGCACRKPASPRAAASREAQTLHA